jgi:hypothetical protein
MKMILPMRFSIFNALLQNILRLLDKLSMQIDRIGLNASIGVVLAEDKFGRLLVVFLHLATVRLALLRQLFGARAIAAGVCFLGLFSRLVSKSTLSLLDAMLRKWCGDHDNSTAMLNRGDWARIPVRNILHAWRLPVVRGRATGRIPARRRRSGRG